MNTKTDNKGRSLLKGESQRKGYYIYQYTDIHHKRRTISAKDLQELRMKKKTLLRDFQNGGNEKLKASLSLDEAFDCYFSGRTDLKHSSRINYSYLYDHYVRHGFGKWRLEELSYASFRAFYLSLAQDYGLSKKTLLLIHAILNQVMKTAVRDNVLKTNPAEGVIHDLSKKYGWEENKRHALTPEQQRAFLTYATSKQEFETIVPLLVVLLGTGLRIGEALGLRWNEDVDFTSKTITVNHNLQYRKLDSGKTGFYISTPKTSSGKRTIPMISQVEQVLLKEKQRQELFNYPKPMIDGYTDFVFVNQKGELFYANAVNRFITRIVTNYNKEELLLASQEKRAPIFLPQISCHHLRHTFCSRLCENETNLKIIQDIMGHASITTTMNRYAEANERKKAESMLNLENKILIL